jgi:uncharacterized protein (UPF0264 family)
VELADQVSHEGLPMLVAGSLSLASIPNALKVDPTYIAIRGAACVGSRTGNIDSQLVRDIKQLLLHNEFVEANTF